MSPQDRRVAAQPPGPGPGAEPIVSVVILTFNEEVNIARAVESSKLLTNDILVLDSGSTDRTREIAESLGARVMVRPFETFAGQRNAALDEGNLTGRFVVFLDADEMVTPEFAKDLKRLLGDRPDLDGVRICRKFHFMGAWARAASSFPRYIDRIVRRGTTRFVQEGHGERFEGGSQYARLSTPLHDEDLKGLHAWIERHDRYARQEAETDLAVLRGDRPDARRFRRWRARLRRLPGWPLAVYLYYMIARRGLLESKGGRVYCALKSVYEYWVQLYMRELERAGKARLQRKSTTVAPAPQTDSRTETVSPGEMQPPDAAGASRRTGIRS